VRQRSTVLVTDDINGQNRGALATVRALAGTRHKAVVTVADRPSLAAASRYCAGTVPVPSGGGPGYAAALRRELDTDRHHLFFPASDVALISVGAAAAELVDKAELDRRARAAGFESLPTEVFGSAAALHEAAEGFDYPVVVKSATKSGLGNLQALTAASAADLQSALGDVPGRLVVQPLDRSPLRAVSGVVHDGELVAVCHQEYRRIWPPAAGVASAAVTVVGDRSLEQPLARLLADHQGVFQVQFLGRYLLDVNPRVYGSMALAVGAGANLPLLACEVAAGRLPTQVVRARPGVHYRWWEGDMRHVLHGLRTGRLGATGAVRALRPHRVESVLAPGPMLSRIAGRVRRSGGPP